jgi:hypothetical protein
MNDVKPRFFSLFQPLLTACLSLSFLLGGLVAPAVAQNIYVAQSTVGAGTGADAADAFSLAWLNTSTNWGSGANQIGPGTTVHLVGTISNSFSILGSGSAGNPITILFEPNALMTSPDWGGGRAIYGSGVHDIVINGGVNGAINATACGWNLPNTTGCCGIILQDPVRTTIENLAITNLFIQTSESGAESSSSSGIVYLSGGNAGPSTNLVTNCVLHDMRNGISINYGPGWTNFTVAGCTISNVNWGIQYGDSGSSSIGNGFMAQGNIIHGFSNWDDQNLGNVYHHDAIIVYGQNGWNTNVVINGNLIGPGFGSATAGIFLEANTYNSLVCNNILLATDGGGPAEGMVDDSVGGAIPNNYSYVFNNDFIGVSKNANGILINNIPMTTYKPNICLTNNIYYNVGFAIANHINANQTVYSDFGCFYALNTYNGQILCIDSSSTTSQNQTALTTWQGYGEDVHSRTGNPVLNSSYVPQAGSAVFNAGANLSQYFTSDFAGNPRPTGTRVWDIGAFQHTGALPPPNFHVVRGPGTNDVNGLVGWWTLDDLSGTDLSTNGNTLTFTGSPGSVTGEITNAVSLNGSSQFASVGSAPVTAVPLTLTGWFNTTSSDGLLFGLFNGAQANLFAYYVYMSSGSTCGITANNNNYSVATSPLTYNDGNWHFSAAVFTSGQQILYMDGNPVQTNSSPQVPTGLNEFCIGAIQRSYFIANYFNGEIDDVRIYNRALSAGEITSQYQWPTGGRP